MAKRRSVVVEVSQDDLLTLRHGPMSKHIESAVQIFVHRMFHGIDTEEKGLTPIECDVSELLLDELYSFTSKDLVSLAVRQYARRMKNRKNRGGN